MSGVAVGLLFGLGVVLILIGVALFAQKVARKRGGSVVGRRSMGKDLSQD